jgi:hypothetical protein
VDLKEYDIEVSAALFKVFIRELPVPLIALKFSEDMGALPGNFTRLIEEFSYVKKRNHFLRCKYLYG